VTADKPLRADAQRNRAHVLEVAEEVFSTRGMSASTEEIARVAGVGIGTVFRHFPTKQALLEAVFVEHFRRLVEEAEALFDTEDPGAAFFEFFGRVVERAGVKIALSAALGTAGVDVERVAGRERDGLVRVLGVLLENAQRAGAVRSDVELPELFAVLVGASRAAVYAGADGRLRDRSLAIVLDGLRPT
jgi:AcrR family transcriptional regulator